MHWFSCKDLDALGEPLEGERYIRRFKIGWVFFDESGAHAYGPYQSKRAAQRGLDDYCDSLNNHN